MWDIAVRHRLQRLRQAPAWATSAAPFMEQVDEAPEREPEGDLDDARYELPPGADPSLDWGLTAHLDAHGQPRVIERELVVEPGMAGLRLDHFIKAQIPRLSRTRVQQVVGETLTRLAPTPSQGPLKSSTKVRAGEVYLLRRAARAEPPCPRHVTVLYEDEAVMVVDKPAGLPVHSTAKFYFNTLTRVLGERFGSGLQICHRLDRETSGALVLAKDRAAAAKVKGAFARKLVRKRYLAVVQGVPPWVAPYTIDATLRVAIAGDPTLLPGVKMLVGEPDGLPSVTHVRTLQAQGRQALVECLPVTGRQHQIRAHLAHVGFPIVGDKLYAHGDAAFMAFCDEGWTEAHVRAFGLWRQALHASRVEFPHPDGTWRDVTAPLPADMQRLLAPDLM